MRAPNPLQLLVDPLVVAVKLRRPTRVEACDGDDRAATVRFLMRSWPMQPLKGAKMLGPTEKL